MKHNTTISSILLLAIAGTGAASAQPPGAAQTTPGPATATALPAAAAIIRHRVRDYNVWKSAFDDHQRARQDAGIIGHHLNRVAQDPSTVVIYLPAGDLARLKSFLDSDELKAKMQQAGVEGPPTITLITPQEDMTIKDRALPAVIVRHRVADYATWKKAFDGHGSQRVQAGIIGHAVNQGVDDPNQVIVYLQAENAGQLKAFVDSEDLKAVMGKAGVQGTPQFSFVNGVEGASY